MKKIMMIVAGMAMVSGAFAEKTTVTQPVTATVNNVCTYAVDSQKNVNDEFFTQPNKDLGSYNALGTTNATVSMGNFYIFRCTSGTPWDNANYAKSGTIELANGDSTKTKKLNVEYTVNVDPDPTLLDTVNGDIHQAGVSFTIPRGQWQARSGNYAGKLTVEIIYN